ncbi:hypothetical protein ACOMHN_063266 [Nucella lapillus]
MEEEKREEVDQNQGTETVQSIRGLPLKERGGGAARPPDRPPDRVRMEEEEEGEEVDQNQGQETVQSIPGLPLKERGGGAARPPDRPPDRVSDKDDKLSKEGWTSFKEFLGSYDACQ